jgi:hypothetical protein
MSVGEPDVTNGSSPGKRYCRGRSTYQARGEKPLVSVEPKTVLGVSATGSDTHSQDRLVLFQDDVKGPASFGEPLQQDFVCW